MNCRHCQHWNPEDEQRCRLCGRKLRETGNDTTSEWALSVVAGNLAAAPERIPRRQAPENVAPSPQRSLFSERPPSKIIPFESRGMAMSAAAAPAPAKTVPARKTAERPATSKTASPKPVASRKNELQGEFELLPSAPITPKMLGTTVDASIFCDAEVATVTHRALAGMVDFSLMLLGYVLCVASYYLMGGALPTTRFGYIAFATAFVLIALFYGFLWALGNGNTPGMYCTRLTLVNFDGQEPELGQRFLRYFATCLSVATCGCGLLWALVDEENLTWQDHMSRTFPTFTHPDTNLCKTR